MMSDGSTLIVTPLSSNGIVGLVRTEPPSMKRRSVDIGVQSCPTRASGFPISMPCTKKLRRYVSRESRSSKVRWKAVLEEHSDETSLPFDEDTKEESKDITSSTVTENETWYSKEQYKQMLLDQSLTVHIMRSLRSIAGEKVAIDYCDEIDSDSSRFDELIKKHQIDPEEYCERGLESYLSDERRNEVNASRKLHKLLVIGEHVRQGMLGSSNPELVRNVSMNQSKRSFLRAQKLASVDQREGRSTAKNNSNTDRKECTQQHQSQKQNAKTVIGQKMDCFLSNGSKFVGKSIDTAVWNLSGDPIKHAQTNEIHAIPDGIRNDILKQHLLQLLMEQEREREQNQRAQSQCHPRLRNPNAITIPDDSSPQIMNSFLASFQRQALEQRLFHQNQQQQQLQIQRNYQTQVQRILLLQQQQHHHESIQLAAAAILGQHHR